MEPGPALSGAHVMLAVTLRERERTEEAVHHYSVGLSLNPAIPAAHYNRAQVRYNDAAQPIDGSQLA